MPIQPPIVLWPREVVLTESGATLLVSFKTDFLTLRRGVDLRSLFESAFGSARVAAETRDGTHLVRIETDDDMSVLKKRVNRIVSALCLIHDPSVGPSVAFALGWNFWPGTHEHTKVGHLEMRAKWKGDAQATRLLGERMIRLVLAHDLLRESRTVVYVSSSKPLAAQLSRIVAEGLPVPLVMAEKVDHSHKQSEAENALDFESTVAQARGSLRLPDAEIAEPVLVVDDLYRTGGTMMEVTRCLRERGLSQVYCLTAAKTVQFHQQT